MQNENQQPKAKRQRKNFTMKPVYFNQLQQLAEASNTSKSRVLENLISKEFEASKVSTDE